MVDDVLEFWSRARGMSLKRARVIWIETVEKKYPEYFEQAIYRDAGPSERWVMLSEFLLQLSQRIEALRRFNYGINDRVMEAVASFRTRFPEYKQQTDIYIGVSFSRFDGSVRPVGNLDDVPDTLCLGADVLASYGPEELQFAITHELFHLYHFGFLLRENHNLVLSPHIPLMIEGMAVAGTEAIYPSHAVETYLHFSKEQLQSQRDRLEVSSDEFLELILDSAESENYAGWFATIPGEQMPPRGGYLLGYEVVKRLLGRYSFEELVRLDSTDLRELAEEELIGLARGRIVLTALD
ncbi:MAG TPA: DUF2268 domain-containing putative Zn-dependent protease [Blastocatellia bacterium]|nr:DUF2268 domain-containing putative Zn-dependent protease [Blastocatellia bacterium]